MKSLTLLACIWFICFADAGSTRRMQDLAEGGEPSTETESGNAGLDGDDTKQAEKLFKYKKGSSKVTGALDWLPKGEPLPEFGQCTAGSSWVITSQEQLYSEIDQLDCIFAAGKAPLAVPLGWMRGRILTTANTIAYATYGENSFRGTYTWETLCDGRVKVFGYDGITPAALPLAFAKWSVVSQFPANSVRIGEVVDNGPGLFADYSVDITEECPVEGDMLPALQPPSLFLPSLSGFKLKETPTSAIRALLRPVGRTPEGETIILGRAFIVDPYRPGEDWMTVGWCVVTASDPAVISDNELPVGGAITLNESFDYNHGANTQEVLARLEALAITLGEDLGILGVETGKYGKFGAAATAGTAAGNLARAAKDRFHLDFGVLGDTGKHYADTDYYAPVGEDGRNEANAPGGVYPSRSGKQRPTPSQHMYMGRAGADSYRPPHRQPVYEDYTGGYQSHDQRYAHAHQGGYQDAQAHQGYQRYDGTQHGGGHGYPPHTY